MSFDINPLPFPASTLNGLSEKLIASHHENNYSGALKRLNAIHTKLGTLDFTQEAGFLLNGLKRGELIAYNSMLLHEIYFDSLGGKGVLPVGPLWEAIERDFGSVERWQAETGREAALDGDGRGFAALKAERRGEASAGQDAA